MNKTPQSENSRLKAEIESLKKLLASSDERRTLAVKKLQQLPTADGSVVIVYRSQVQDIITLLEG